MQQVKQLTGQLTGQGTGQAADQMIQSERKRVEAVVETLATLRGEEGSLAGLAHDARNMVTALGLYCDLLEEPGVLATQFVHYGSELRLVAAASRRLVEKLVALDVRGNAVRGSAVRGIAAPGGNRYAVKTPSPLAGLEDAPAELPGFPGRLELPAGITTSGQAAKAQASTSADIGPATVPRPGGQWDLMPPELISNLAQELLASRNLLSALAGPSIALSVDVEGGALPVRLNAEDLTRVLVNLVKNAAEAMPAGGSIRIGLRKRSDPVEAGAGAGFNAGSSAAPNAASHTDSIPALNNPELSLTVEDNGTGIPRKALERIFEAGFTTRATGATAEGLPIGGWPSAHRGLGLSITRSIVEAAGGRIYATNREGSGTPGRGARFEIVLPVRGR
jgi:signal transduction histidine kinase